MLIIYRNIFLPLLLTVLSVNPVLFSHPNYYLSTTSTAVRLSTSPPPPSYYLSIRVSKEQPHTLVTVCLSDRPDYPAPVMYLTLMRTI